MITASTGPLFGAQTRQHASREARSIQSPSEDTDMLDSITVAVPQLMDVDTFSSRSTSPDRENDPNPHLRAKLPQVGDVFNSRSGGNLRKQAALVSEKELKRDLEQHTAFKTYHALDLLLDLDHPLEADKASANPAQDRYNALRQLYGRVKNPAGRLSGSSKRYLQSVGLISPYGTMDKATFYDIGNILKVSPKSQAISVKMPNRSEAKTYWKKPMGIGK